MHTRQTYLSLLAEQARLVRDLEAQAAGLLHQSQDQSGYQKLMRDKALTLAALPDTLGEPPVGQDGFGKDQAKLLGAGLDDFARRANNALDIGSVFYMSVLLYPEDYQEGEPNDLERFVASFQKD